MEDEGNENQPKQERLRTRWTAALDKIFADIVVRQIELGNRPNNVFDKKTWNLIREEFNSQTNLSFNNNQLRKHLDVLRTRYNGQKSTMNQQDPMEDSCFAGFELWDDIREQRKPLETAAKVKDSPIYDQLCKIFADSSADGNYAQSSHYETGGREALCPEPVNACPETPAMSTPVVQGNYSSPIVNKPPMSERKRKRPVEVQGGGSGENNANEKMKDKMAEALFEMIAASKLRTNAMMSKAEDKFTITNCIKALDEIEGVDEWLYYSALDLFEDPVLREMFLSLKSNSIRLTWLQGKYGQFAQ